LFTDFLKMLKRSIKLCAKLIYAFVPVRLVLVSNNKEILGFFRILELVFVFLLALGFCLVVNLRNSQSFIEL
jgi:hypothetical protein